MDEGALAGDEVVRRGSESPHSGAVSSLSRVADIGEQPELDSRQDSMSGAQDGGHGQEVEDSSKISTGSVPWSCPSARLVESAPGPSPSLLATLQGLGEHSDHTLLPQSLHQIAEGYFLEKDYEWAVQFLQLERLYHERLLSNLITLQEQWESQKREGAQRKCDPCVGACTQPPLQHLDTLSHICRTHQRPTLGVQKHWAGDNILNHCLAPRSPSRGDTQGDALLSCDPGNVAESAGHAQQWRVTEGSPAHGTMGSEAVHSTTLNQADAAPTALDIPTLAATNSWEPEVGDGGAPCAAAEGGSRPTKEPEGFPGDRLADSSTLCGLEDRGPDLMMGLARVQVTAHDAHETAQSSVSGEQQTRTGHIRNSPTRDEPSVPGTEEENEEWEQEEREELEDGDVPEEALECDLVGDGLKDMTGTPRKGKSSLDDLAKRIQVEEITPAEGLVSILKRRASLEGAASPKPPPPKQGSRRRVRFREPEDGVDQDEMGGDSCLILLFLCLATVVISVGGTALYCTFGDAQSSICTDFSHNVDFYFSHLQRGMEELKHWFSPSS